MRVALAGAVATVATSVLLSGCSGTACSDVGGSDELSLETTSDARAGVETFHVQLCQRDDCYEIAFPTRVKASGTAVGGGMVVFRNGETYLVGLNHLGLADDQETQLTLTGTSPGGDELVRFEESFEFDKWYPNGQGCDPTSLRHETVVSAEERVSG